MPADLLHLLVRRGDLPAVQKFLGAPQPGASTAGINAFDPRGYTPLMHAVMKSGIAPALVHTLLEHGADVNLEAHPEEPDRAESVMSLALRGDNAEVVRLLLDRGASLHYRRRSGYNAAVDAAYRLGNRASLDLLRLLIEQGVDLNAVTQYNESALRVLSRVGRFDAVQLLLDAEADENQLAWNPLLRAVALGTVDDLRASLDGNPALEARDYWERTAFLLAIQTGDIGKVEILLARGADPDARGRCGKPPLFYAIETPHPAMLRFLLENGQSAGQTDEYDDTPLMTAAGYGNAEAIDLLLGAGAAVDTQDKIGETALRHTEDRACAARLLAAWADPQGLSYEARRALLGLPPDPDESLLDVTPAQYQTGCVRRFGEGNPQETTDAYRLAMIRAGIDAWHAAQFCEDERGISERPPGWCARRFGQSITFLPDGRIVQVAGEHEDYYDPDFCIYNDVFVHHPDGTIQIFDYPKEVFPPTDFHTATLIGTDIYLIGSLGYNGERQYGTTPVYRLDTGTLRIEPVPSGGEVPGWTSRHTATLVSAQEIRVSGGKIGTEESYADNAGVFVFHVGRGTWTREG